MATATLTTTAVAGGVIATVDRDIQSNASIAAAASASNVPKQIRTDNRLNSSERVYTKLYNTATPTIGTTAPDIQIACHANEMIEVIYDGGLTFGTGLAFITAQESGTPASGGTSNPSIDATAIVGRA